MTLIIDAYNLLHCTHILPDRYALVGVTGLARLLLDSRYARQRIVIVCDGTPPRGHLDVPGVQIIFSGPGREADAVIERLVAEDSAPRQLTVVSNDRRVQRAARKRRGQALACETFLRQITDDVRDSDRDHPEPDRGPLEPDETAAWLAEFGYDVTEQPPQAQDPDPRDDPSSRTDIHTADYWLKKFGFDEDES